jgi:hypothetical protein
MYWAYVGRTNNSNKISPSEMLTRFCRIRQGYVIDFSFIHPPSLGGAGTSEGLLRLPGLETLSEPHTNQCYGARKAGTYSNAPFSQPPLFLCCIAQQ